MLEKILMLPVGILGILFSVFSFSLDYSLSLPFVIFYSVFLSLPLPLLPLVAVLPQGRVKNRLQLWSEGIMGIYFYLMIALMADALLLFISYFAKWSVPLLPLFLVTAGIFLITVLAAVFHARKVKILHQNIVLKTEFPSKDKEIALFSDLHLGFFTTKAHLERIVEKLNSMDTDTVFFTGDFFDGTFENLRFPKEAFEILSKMKFQNRYMCFGNHDGDILKDENARNFLEALHFMILEDEEVSLPYCTLYGRKDETDETRLPLEQLSPLLSKDREKPLIILDHRPKEADSLRSLGADLVLCGHTHGGQTFPGTLLSRMLKKHTYGLKNNVFTTCGCGYWGVPLRLFITNETVLLHLHFENAKE